MKNLARLILILLIAPLASFGQKSFEGKMTMSIKLTTTDPAMKDAEQYMPKEMTLYTKGARGRVETNSMMGMTIILTDTIKREAVVCMDMMGNKIAMLMPFDDMSDAQEEMKASTNIEYTSESKTIAGYRCKKAIITSTAEGKEIKQTVWFTEEIQNTSVEYYELKGMPMEYEMNAEGMKMQYSVTAVSKEKVADSLFEVPEGYTITTQEEMMKSFQGLDEVPRD